MAKLRFYARDAQLVYKPGARAVDRQAPHYVGRTLVMGADGAARYSATEEAYECDSATEAGRLLCERVRHSHERHNDQCLWPADAATAEACGVPFQKVKRVAIDGGGFAWVADTESPGKSSSKGDK